MKFRLSLMVAALFVSLTVSGRSVLAKGAVSARAASKAATATKTYRNIEQAGRQAEQASRTAAAASRTSAARTSTARNSIGLRAYTRADSLNRAKSRTTGLSKTLQFQRIAPAPTIKATPGLNLDRNKKRREVKISHDK